MDVSVIGPNLIDQSKGGIHVHKFGCADTKKAEYRYHRVDVGVSYSFIDRREVVEFIYPPGDFGYDPHSDEINDYAGDIYFFPCVDGLPEKFEAKSPIRRHAPKSRKR